MRILTPGGYVDASAIQVGDEVSAFDLDTGAPIVNYVVSVEFVDESADDPATYSFRINGGEPLYQNQSVWVKLADGSWNVTRVELLGVGDTICDGSDQDLTIASIVPEPAGSWYRFEISGDHSYIADDVTLHNASRFWVLASGTWDTSTTTNWSASSGGSGGASAPTTSDDVTLNDSSGNSSTVITFAASPNCLTFTAAARTISWSIAGSGITMTVAGTTANFGNVGSSGSATHTLKFTSAGTINYTPNASSGPGSKFSAIQVTGGGTLTLQDSLGNPACSVSFTNSSLNANGNPIDVLTLTASGTGSFTFGAINVTLEGSNGTLFSVPSTSVSAASASIVWQPSQTQSGTVTFALGGKSYSAIQLNGGSATGIIAITGANTLGQVTDTGSAAHTIQFPAGTTQTISTAFSVSGGSTSTRISLRSDTPGSQFTLSKASGTVNCDFLDIKDSAATGGATWNAGSHSLDGGDNTGWVFASNIQPRPWHFSPGPSPAWVRRTLQMPVLDAYRVLTITADFGLRTEDGAVVQIDLSDFPLESLLTARQDADVDVEAIATQRRDGTPQAEMSSSARIDTALPSEITASVRADRIVRLEDGLSVQIDARLSTEGTITVQSVRHVEAETLMAARADAPITVEIGGLLKSDNSLLSESASAIRKDGSIWTENGLALRRDLSPTAEIGASAVRHAVGPNVEVISSLRSDSSVRIEIVSTITLIDSSATLPLEFAGVVQHDVGASMPVEWSAAMRSDGVLRAETFYGVRADFALIDEILRTARADATVRIEGKAGVARDGAMPSETSAALMIDTGEAGPNVESLSSVLIDETAPAEETQSLQNDYPSQIEAGLSVLADRTPAAESNATARLDGGAPVEATGRVRVDLPGRAEITLAMRRDTPMRAETTLLARADAPLALESFARLRADQSTTDEILRTARGDSGIRAEIGLKVTAARNIRTENVAAMAAVHQPAQVEATASVRINQVGRLEILRGVRRDGNAATEQKLTVQRDHPAAAEATLSLRADSGIRLENLAVTFIQGNPAFPIEILREAALTGATAVEIMHKLFTASPIRAEWIASVIERSAHGTIPVEIGRALRSENVAAIEFLPSHSPGFTKVVITLRRGGAITTLTTVAEDLDLPPGSY